ncbi:MAG: type II toxin-antitoxin system Phd/YefM family antitoxin [Thermoleophilaceae bacterium]
MARRTTIPQRELRNDIARVLRDAEAREQFTVTVRGRPVASLGPLDEAALPRVDVDSQTLRAILARTPADPDLADDLAALRSGEAAVDDPWPAG